MHDIYLQSHRHVLCQVLPTLTYSYLLTLSGAELTYRALVSTQFCLALLPPAVPKTSVCNICMSLHTTTENSNQILIVLGKTAIS